MTRAGQMGEDGRRETFIHIGLMKTGTTYVQAALRSRRAELRTRGLAIVPGTPQLCRRLSWQVRGMHDVTGPLELLPQRLESNGAPRQLITEETLAAATSAQAGVLVDRVREASDRVRLIVTVRDLARHLPSAWQQATQNSETAGLTDWVEDIARERGDTFRHWRRFYDVPAVLDRWAKVVPPEDMQVVVVPRSGAEQTLLLRLVLAALGIDFDDGLAPAQAIRSNPSLGRAQIEVLNQVRSRLPERFDVDPLEHEAIRKYLVRTILVQQPAESWRLDPAHAPFCAEQTQRILDHLAALGVQVVGDLADLGPDPRAFEAQPEARSEDILEACLQALAASVVDRFRDPDQDPA